MTPPLRLYHVDVFAERPFAGNPLAVVLGGESLSAGAFEVEAGLLATTPDTDGPTWQE